MSKVYERLPDGRPRKLGSKAPMNGYKISVINPRTGGCVLTKDHAYKSIMAFLMPVRDNNGNIKLSPDDHPLFKIGGKKKKYKQKEGVK